MSWSQVSFVGRRAAGNLRALFWTHVLTSGTMALTLFVFGAAMLVETNLQILLKGWGDQIQMNAYLERGLGAGETEALLNRVRALPEVLRVRHITQDQAWRDFSAALGAQSGVLEGLPRDVLPASFEISVRPGSRDAPAVERLAARLKQEKGVALVEYPRDWIDRLAMLVSALGWLKWILAGVLFAITFFIVSSTVKLAMLARTDEIEIMQLVGSSRTMIQAPFILEGLVQGLVGGLFAVLGLWGAFVVALREFSHAGVLWGAPGEWRFLALEGILSIVSLGCLLGLAGSFFSVGGFIRKWRSS